MKHIIPTIFLLAAMTVAHGVYGQSTPASDRGVAYEYGQIVGTQKIYSIEVSVTVDLGQGSASRKEGRGKDSGQPAFTSIPEAMNHLAADGWEFVQAYVVVNDERRNQHYWVIRRRK